jgi:peptide subunit release factor 1 (eRF1)
MSIRPVIDELAAFEPSSTPVISLYLNLQPDQHGRDNYEAFVRKEFKERLRSFPPRSAERESVDRDVEKIHEYLKSELRPSANGLAIFACSARDLFTAVQIDAPIEEHLLYVTDQPHLYPLARVDDQYPRYAALVVDTNLARLFVFGVASTERTETLESTKMSRSSMGGWSQARYQRRVDTFREQHAREVVELLERIVTAEGIEHVILAGDEVVLPMIRGALSKAVADRVVDTVKMDITTPDHEIARKTLDALREQDAQSDREVVERMLGAHRAGGLGVAGREGTLDALEKGQVEELIISASLGGGNGALVGQGAAAEPGDTATAGELPPEQKLADELVTKAAQTSARVTFIEDSSLLEHVDGVGALLRFRI